MFLLIGKDWKTDKTVIVGVFSTMEKVDEAITEVSGEEDLFELESVRFEVDKVERLSIAG